MIDGDFTYSFVKLVFAVDEFVNLVKALTTNSDTIISANVSFNTPCDSITGHVIRGVIRVL